MTKLSIKSNANRVAAKILSLQKKIAEESKRKTRAFIRSRISRLQRELNFLVNQYERTPGTNKDITAQPLAQKIAEEQAFGKSRAVSYGDDFHTTMDSPTLKASIVNTDSGHDNYAMRVRADNLHADATYEEYRDQFISTLPDKVFAIQDGVGGSYRYYIIPPGSPLLDEVLDGVKIFCSSFTDAAGAGRPDGDPLQDIGLKKGRSKFNRDKENKGYTEFTLKETALKAIKERGTDVTGIVLNTQHGEYEDASTIARQYNSSAMRDAFTKAQDAIEGRNITPEAQAVANTNKAISNITVKEGGSANVTTFTIQTTIDTKEFVSDEVLHAAKRELLLWSSSNAPEMGQTLTAAFDAAIKKFNQKG